MKKDNKVQFTPKNGVMIKTQKWKERMIFEMISHYDKLEKYKNHVYLFYTTK